MTEQAPGFWTEERARYLAELRRRGRLADPATGETIGEPWNPEADSWFMKIDALAGEEQAQRFRSDVAAARTDAQRARGRMYVDGVLRRARGEADQRRQRRLHLLRLEAAIA
jgi:hypothetical protein